MAFLYPWGNTQQLNLDWILQKIKELEAGSGGADLDEVANALISASYAVQAYDRSDIVFRDGKLYRANQAIPAPGEVWTPAHWDEILLGDTVSNLVQYVAALSNDQIANSSNVSGTHTSDALNTLKSMIEGITLDSDNVSNESQVTGDNVTDALDNLNNAISDNATAITNTRRMIANVYDSGETATVTYQPGELIIYAGYTAQVIAPIAVGDSFIWNTNIKGTTISTELYAWASHADGTFTLNTNTDTIAESRFIQKGRICEVHFSITRSGGFTAGTEVTLGNLSGMQRPPVNIRTINGCGAAPYAITGMCYMILGASGNIVVTPQINCNSILVDFVYLAD